MFVMLPRIRGCSIYRHDVGTATGMRLHPAYTPCEWEHQQHALEVWLPRVVEEEWPWRAASMEDADIALVDGLDLARWCTVTRMLHMAGAFNREQSRVQTCNGATAKGACGSWRLALANGRPSPASSASPQWLCKHDRWASALAELQRRANGSRAIRWTRQGAIKQSMGWDPDGTPEYSGHRSPPLPAGIDPGFGTNVSTGLILSEETRRAFFEHALQDPMLRRLRVRGPLLKVVALTSVECDPPYACAACPPVPADVLLLEDFHNSETTAADHHVVPHVVSRPAWLVGEPGASPPTPVLPWPRRQLLFFHGHIPKVYWRKTRYQLWKQLRRSSHVTLSSSTINCTVGA